MGPMGLRPARDRCLRSVLPYCRTSQTTPRSSPAVTTLRPLRGRIPAPEQRQPLLFPGMQAEGLPQTTGRFPLLKPRRVRRGEDRCACPAQPEQALLPLHTGRTTVRLLAAPASLLRFPKLEASRATRVVRQTEFPPSEDSCSLTAVV
jgi:hypothetical protein